MNNSKVKFQCVSLCCPKIYKEEGADVAEEHKSKHQIRVDVDRAMNSIDFFIDLQEEQL